MTASWRPDHSTPHWHAQLTLRLEKSTHKTVIRDLKHLGPVRVLRPYYPENDGAIQIYLLHPPGALVGGDLVEFLIEAGKDTEALLTTPSAGKFNRALTNLVQIQHNRIMLRNNSLMEWMPQENIFFNAAQAKAVTEINLDEQSCFAGWDISCFGRPAANEVFDTGTVRTHFKISQADVPIFNESCRFELPKMNSAFKFAMQGRTVSGLFCANKIGLSAVPEKVSLILEQHDAVLAATHMKDWLIIRYFGDSAEKAKQLFISIWSELKPAAWNKEFSAPRIWAH